MSVQRECVAAHPTLSKLTMRDFVSLEDIRDRVGGGCYVIIFMCPARKNTYRRAHERADKNVRIRGESERIPNKSSGSDAVVGGATRKRGSTGVLGSRLRCTCWLRESILGIKLTRGHAPGEQYTMQMKLFHMASQLSTQHTQKHVRAEEPSAFPNFHAKSAKPCNSSVCDREKKGNETRGKQNERTRDG